MMLFLVEHVRNCRLALFLAKCQVAVATLPGKMLGTSECAMIHEMRTATLKVFHNPGNAMFRGDGNHQMNMIGHTTNGMDTAIKFGRFIDQAGVQLAFRFWTDERLSVLC